MASPLAKTPLHDWHAAHGGRMVDFAGWSMPVQYTSIVAEHTATRTAATLFDVSHMGRLRFAGPGAAEFLDGVVTRRVTDMQPGRFAMPWSRTIRRNSGRRAGLSPGPTKAGERHLMVVNASNREKIVAWIDEKLAGRTDVHFWDWTTEIAMIAVQGPLAADLLQPLVDHDLAAMKYYHAAETKIAGQLRIVSRTGYTGEDGFELMVFVAVALWEGFWQRQRSGRARRRPRRPRHAAVGSRHAAVWSRIERRNQAARSRA